MAGRIDKILSYLKLTDEEEYDDDFYDDDYDDDYDEKELRREEKRVQREKRRENKRSGERYSRSEYDDYDEPPASLNSRSSSSRSSSVGKVISIHNDRTQADLEVNIVRPNNFGDSQQVCEILLNGQPAVVNLEGIDIQEAQRIMDFISGCIFSISGNMRQVSRYIFIFAPKNVDISGDYINNFSAAGDDRITIPTLNKEF